MGRNTRGINKNGWATGIITFSAIAAIFLLLASAGCTGQPEPSAQGEEETAPLTVAVTILPQKEFVEEIAGDYARVIVLVPPGASPHTYEPTVKQLEEMSSADVYFKVGSGIDVERAWMYKLGGINTAMTIVDTSAGIQFIAGGHDDETISGAEHIPGPEGYDPHIWLSPRNAKIMVENTFYGLATADPAHAGMYRENADTYSAKLDTIDRNITREIKRAQTRTFMVYHPAWSYFARDYGLVQVPIETDGKEPTPMGIENLIRKAKEENITVIFASPESSTKSADVIAREIGGEVVLVSALEEDYLENIKNVADAFARSGR
jgi:zinc transport system substrate-binding protein